MTSDDGPFESEQHPVSRRWALVEDDGSVAWLYMTAPDSLDPVATCFLYNHAGQVVPRPADIHFRWSTDGESVAVHFGTILMGFIASGEKRGFSKLLTSTGVLGAPLDTNLYERKFRAT